MDAEVKLSRQRRWQLQKKASGLCQNCGKEARKDASMCDKCGILKRQRQRQRLKALPNAITGIGRPTKYAGEEIVT